MYCFLSPNFSCSSLVSAIRLVMMSLFLDPPIPLHSMWCRSVDGAPDISDGINSPGEYPKNSIYIL